MTNELFRRAGQEEMALRRWTPRADYQEVRLLFSSDFIQYLGGVAPEDPSCDSPACRCQELGRSLKTAFGVTMAMRVDLVGLLNRPFPIGERCPGRHSEGFDHINKDEIGVRRSRKPAEKADRFSGRRGAVIANDNAINLLGLSSGDQYGAACVLDYPLSHAAEDDNPEVRVPLCSHHY